MVTRFALTPVLAVALLLPLTACADASARHANVVQVSHCPEPPDAEVVQAVDGSHAYEAWIGCGGIGFARSSDGGKTFGASKMVPGSRPVHEYSWDPALAVGPDGALYVAYMVGPSRKRGGTTEAATPVVAVSHDHGATFPRVSALPIPSSPHQNFGDRPFIAVAPNGNVYVTWDYGPRRDEVQVVCPPTSSCYFNGGDFNAVFQTSTDDGKTWSDLTPISGDYPLGGVYSAPIVTEPNGALDVLFWQHPTDPNTLKVSPGHEYFIRSTDGAQSWTKPVLVGAKAGTIGVKEWWIDGSLAVDSAGTLYVSWDTQRSGRRDTGWLAWSTDHGAHWHSPLAVASSKTEHLTEVAVAGRKNVYVGWQTLTGKGYATLLRRYAVGHGWTGPAKQISPMYGRSATWPGDTFGLSVVGGKALVSWGSATGKDTTSQIWFSTATLPTR
jgi:hypothetical protein